MVLVAIVWVAGCLGRASLGRADTVELVNGDHFTGSLVSLNRTNLQFHGEIVGTMNIPRAKARWIDFSAGGVPAGAAGAIPSANLGAHQDVLQLANGDHYSGNIVELKGSSVQFQSEIQGPVSIPRGKISRIYLASPGGNFATAPTAGVATQGTNAVVQQLQTQGVDPNLMTQLQQQMFGQSSPEATQMFNSMVAGLRNGTLGVGDIRAQASRAIADIEAAKKELGDDADTKEMLDGYLAVLQKFVSDSGATSASGAPASSPAPAAVGHN